MGIRKLLSLLIIFNSVWNSSYATGGFRVLPLGFTNQFSDSVDIRLISNFAKPTVAIGLDRMNTLYIGMDNPISIATSAGGDDKMVVSIKGAGGLITKTGVGRFNVRVNNLSDECIISISVGGKLVGSSQFRVRNLPPPTSTIGGFASGDSIHVNAFRAQAGIGAYLRDFSFDLSYEVVSYTLNIYNSNEETKRADCKGAMFSEEARVIINSYLKSGSTIIVERLFLKDGEGRIFKVPSLLYYIK